MLVSASPSTTLAGDMRLRPPRVLSRVAEPRVPSLEVRDLPLYTLDRLPCEFFVLLSRITLVLTDMITNSAPMPIYLPLVISHASTTIPGGSKASEQLTDP